MHGNGTFTWPDRRKYVGGYMNGKKEGFGQFYFADGTAYIGYWKDGK